MDVNLDCDWKKKVGFPINYESGQSSDDEFDTKDVVFRNPPSSSRYLLADGGDGSEADLLGTTPPRSRIRDKEKRRSYMGDTVVVRAAKDKRDVVDAVADDLERYRKRGSQKLIRSKERDWKLDMSLQNKADSLPSPNPVAAVPPLVESCSRFMSLTSRPKCRQTIEVEEAEPVEPTVNDQCEVPASRVTFHKTFSMLINMGNVEKGCRRTISREEQVWQNELKDLIWLELQAKIAGRTLAQQDAYLCTQRKIVPTVINNILEYKFINDSPCRGPISSDDEEQKSQENLNEKDLLQNGIQHNCLSFDCQSCSDAVGRAMKEVFGLLEAYYDAVSLYPSTKAMTVDHPLVATPEFKNRFKAMCLWFNTALSMRLKMLAVRRLLRSMKLTNQADRQRVSHDSEAPRDCPDNPRVCQVRFNTSDNSSTSDPSPTGSHNSDASTKETEDKQESEGESRHEDHDSGVESQRNTNPETPEIVIDSRYSSANTAETTESGYMSSPESPNIINCTPSTTLDTDVFNVGVDDELTRLRLLGKCPVSLYRNYHQEMLKTQGVRRCMMFIIKLRKYLLSKVSLTLEKPDTKTPETEINEPAEVFQEPKEDNQDQQDGDLTKMFELRRYGCWSSECLDMRLPSYRAHFLLLNAICLEALHDYLSLRLDAAPEAPSCLTIKQLMTELKEGLDIATEIRVEFVRSASSALAGQAVPAPHLLRVIQTFDDTIETVLKLYLSFLTKMSEKEPLRRGMLQAEWAFTAKLARRVRCAHNLAPPAFSIMASNQLKRLVKQFNTEMETIKNDTESVDAEGIDPDKHTIYAVLRALQSIYARNRAAVIGAAAWARVLAARLARAPPPSYLTQRQEIFEALMGLRDTIMQHIEMILFKSSDVDYHEPIQARVRELLLQVSKLGFELHRELYHFGCGPLRLTAERQARPASLQPPPRRPPRLPRPRPGTVLIQAHNPVLNDLQLGITKELHQFVHESTATRPNCAGGGSPPRGPPRAPPRSRLFLRGDSVIEDAEAHVFDDKLLDGETPLGDNTTHTSFELLLTGQPADEKVELRREDIRLANTQEQEWASRVARAVIEFAKTWMRFVLDRCDRGRGLRPRWASQGLEFLMLACDPCNTKHLTDEEFEELKQLMDGCISHVIGSRPSAECTPSPRPRHRLHSPFPSTNSVNKESPPPSSLYTDTDPLQSLESLDPNNRSRRVLQAIQQLDESREEKLREANRVGRVQAARAPTYTQKLRRLTFKWQRGLKIGAGSFGKIQDDTGDLHGVSQPVISKTCKKVAGILARISNRFIKMPGTLNEQEEVMRKFRSIANFPTVIGAIDCSHIHVKKMRADEGQLYINRKGHPSINVQVYTIVNTESGQLLAMKELSIGAADRRAFQRAANELQVLEGVIHPHLVRYYGCELHREEMLLFMELCVEGSLEALIATSGGLQEITVRRYTKQLLSAVHALHSRSIAHRDIKSGNIFLTNDGHCLKLGDFGCAVKIRANTTAPNELQGFVGTQAYMAPEVFMKSSGHGRAADIWSVGCVITEMASGKRPFIEYDSNYQIMFMVGMGHRPTISNTLSEEGREFCELCLTHDPDKRPRAHELMLHSFLLVKSDDDCKCEPAYLMT